MKPPRVRLAFWEKQNSPLGRLLQTRWVYPEKISHTGGSGWRRRRRRRRRRRGRRGGGGSAPGEDGGEGVEGREGEAGREELMPTAQQRPPPPPRAERSTGKERRSRGPQGVQVQGDCQCLHFNSRATPSERFHLHPTTATPPRLHPRVHSTNYTLSHTQQKQQAGWDTIMCVRLSYSFGAAVCFFFLCVCVCLCVFGGCGWFCWCRTGNAQRLAWNVFYPVRDESVWCLEGFVSLLLET